MVVTISNISKLLSSLELLTKELSILNNDVNGDKILGAIYNIEISIKLCSYGHPKFTTNKGIRDEYQNFKSTIEH